MALSLIEYIRHEQDYLPLNIFLLRVKYYSEILEFSSISESFSNYLAEIIEPTYNRLGWFEKVEDSWTDK